ncbi:Crp/Fnr family transcriptional regulator [Comamonas sp. NLF-1-9]|uniref:Crp/Fnr family transcriptional regulator n=1 Tax=Comamonas sp. NLF-1-9 TaxID=2853163 RepID=UPI001C43F977|nr:Crp/Fnr family transcriptional regulator [Comamonas sp. NLF-1-9]QXL84976.1 Crp/Fnr family transcriptional regulator [Comamonas sp. NLF-1-9]
MSPPPAPRPAPAAPAPAAPRSGDAGAGDPAQRMRALLSQLPLFAGLSEPELAQLAAATQRHSLAPAETIVRRGERCSGMYFVIYGSVQLVYNAASGSERTVRLLAAGASFGEAALFSGREHIVTATALADTLVLQVPQAVLRGLVAGNNQVAQRMIARLSEQLYMAIADFGAFTTHSGPQRLIGYLLRESTASAGLPFTLDVSKRTIASRLNLTPAHFSRILHDLSERGLIRVNGREILVLDEPALRDYHLSA